MKIANNSHRLRELCLGAKTFPPEILKWIIKENFWNLWVPRSHGGLETPLIKGLQTLKTLAKIDGSLGWTVTLGSGANYFIGNLEPVAAHEIFNPSTPARLGGSGAVGGTAEKQGDCYTIKGKWPYATGADYLTHFTLNAKVSENGKILHHPDGSTQIRSFVIPEHKVRIIKDWNTMGLKASVTHSFEVEPAKVHQKFSFLYNQYFLPQSIFKIPFEVFADLTLWVNYIGIAEHFYEEACEFLTEPKLKNMETVIRISDKKVTQFAEEVEETIGEKGDFPEDFAKNIHENAKDSVEKITQALIETYPLLGVKASTKGHQLNQIFMDYFTATQHHIFTRK